MATTRQKCGLARLPITRGRHINRYNNLAICNFLVAFVKAARLPMMMGGHHG
jgi:hypothetical protein